MRSHIFELARQATIDPETSGVIDWLEDALRLFATPGSDELETTSDALFSANDDCAKRICTLLDMTRQKADVCVFTITDNRIRDAILEAHRRNVSIRIISDKEKSLDIGSDIESLSRNGIPVRMDVDPGHMHHKYALFDSRRLITGSYNWTRSAATENEENLIVTGDAKLIGQFQQHFESLWRQYG